MDRAGWSYPEGHLRVSDIDRDRAVAELSQAFQAGRITANEFDQRSGQALSARTGTELTRLLADLPVVNVPATRPIAPKGAQRVHANRIALAAGVAAICFAAAAAAAAVNTGPSLQQREFLREMMARQGWPIPPQLLRAPGFDWPGTMVPAAIAVLLVVLIIGLRVRLARDDRR